MYALFIPTSDINPSVIYYGHPNDRTITNGDMWWIPFWGGWGLILLYEEFFHSTIFSEGHRVTWLLFLWPLVTSEICTCFCTQACKICSLFDMGGECYCCPQTSPAPSQLTAGSEDHLWGHPEIFTCCNGRDQTRLYYFLFNYGYGHVEKRKGYMIIYYRNLFLFLSANHNCDVF